MSYPRKWCISWISFFDNVMHMDFVYATDEVHALKQAFSKATGTDYDESFDSDIKQAAFDCDSMIGTIQIDT